jgi:glutaredoxin 3
VSSLCYQETCEKSSPMSSHLEVETFDADAEVGVEKTVPASHNRKVDLEKGAVVPQEEAINRSIVVTDLESYPGSDTTQKLDAAIDLHKIFIVSKSNCPFCRDVKDLLVNQLGATIHSVEINEHPLGSKIFALAKAKTGKTTVPQVFIKGDFVGGCDDLKALHHKGALEQKLKGIVSQSRAVGTDTLETAHLIPVERSLAMNPPLWFPNVVNNYVIRVVGFQVCTLSVLSAVYYDEVWAHWVAAFVLVDFCLRFSAGSSASPLGMIATLVTSPFRPQFRPGPPKQFASFCGIMFSGLGTIFYFLDFQYHEYLGLAFMAGLAGASGLEWSLDFCLGCKFFAIGIYLGLIPDYVYRVYTSSLQETNDSWDYMFLDSNAPHPETVNTYVSQHISLPQF